MKPHSHEEHIQHSFDAFCKKVLRNEARDYQDALARKRNREVYFSELPIEVLEQFAVRDTYFTDIRAYIADYENESNAGKVTLDNIRRNISSFFAWLEDENYIVKSPARRIHKIRVSIQTNSLHGGMAFSIASSQDSFPVMGFCVYPRFSNNLSNKCPKSTQNTPVCNKTH